MLKRDHIYCVECGAYHHEESAWKENCERENVCGPCSENMPVLKSVHPKNGPCTFWCKFGSAEVSYTHKFPSNARAMAIRMCNHQWGYSKPIEEKES